LDTDPLPAIEFFGTLLLSTGVISAGNIAAVVCSIIFLGFSGFISGSEIAYFSLTPQHREKLEETERGKAILKLLSQPERLLATILIANNLVNVTIVVLLNFALGPVFSGMSAVLSFILQSVILTFLILLFGEILPKLYANHNPLGWARMAYPGLKFAVTLCSPLSGLLVRSSTIVNRFVTREDPNISTDDLSQALEITDVRGADDKEMLEGILNFGSTTASQIMTPRVDLTDIEYSASFEEVLDIVVSSGYARLPVYEDTEDTIKGILYSRDLLPYIGTDLPSDFRWQSLIREAYYVPESRMIDDLLEDFRKRRIHMAIVVDEYGGTQGVVTLEDVLEEIVGDINDEYDEEETTYKRLQNDTYIFEGRTLLNDFFRITGLDADDFEPVIEDAETLAGMLLAIKGDFPKDKESVVYGRCRFLILDISEHRITSVRVRVMPAACSETGASERSDR